MDIYLVRHGEAEARWGDRPDPGLTRLGRQQARKVRDQLESTSDLKIASSPMLRARESAHPLANIRRESIVVEPSFREIPTPPGLADRRTWLRTLMKQNWDEQSPEILQWRDGIWSALFELDGHTAIFTHFMVINAVVGRLTEAEGTVCCVPDYGSITRLRLEQRTLQLVELGRQHMTEVK